jgi:adenylyltransferase/sulfurtransferase
MVSLTDYDRLRYGRQMMIPGWGETGQLRLKGAQVFVAGAGGLGSPVATYLAVAGVGEIRICDADRVELSNLNRQILHMDSRIGDPKAQSAAQTLHALNPTVHIVPQPDTLEQASVERLVGHPDLVIDCLDNFETRYVLNAYCQAEGIPLIHGAVGGLLGQVTFLHPPETPCLRCIFPEAPPRGTFPVVGVTPGVIGCIQAAEAIKYLTGVGTVLKGQLLIFDGESMEFTPIRVERVPFCPVCGSAP